MHKTKSIAILPDADECESAAHGISAEPGVTNTLAQSGSRQSTGCLLPSNIQARLLSASKEINEANAQFIRSALRYCEGFPGAEVANIAGWIAPWRNTPVPISNAIFLSRPVEDEADLHRRARALVDFVKEKQKPPMLLLCLEWVPEILRGAADGYFASAGLVTTTTMTGMAADALLSAPRVSTQPEWRRAADEVTRKDFADINSAAYGFPVEAERAALCVPQVWGVDGLNGYVGYLRNGSAAAAAGVMVLHNKLHVVCVATRPEHQRLGFAEAAIRHALDDMQHRIGLKRTTLTATEAGKPLYRRMGFHNTATFAVYTRSEDQNDLGGRP